MNEFMCEGGTYHKHISGMLYHTYLVAMLGSAILAKSVEEVVLSNDCNELFRRDHLERDMMVPKRANSHYREWICQYAYWVKSDDWTLVRLPLTDT